MTTIKARPTLYKGTPMRSRLEALFAQHCDEAGLSWKYEPSCFADETGQYLPDFVIRDGDEIAYVEVKPRKTDAVEWIDGPMRRIWSSDPSAHLVAVYPHRLSEYESTQWDYCYRSAPATTWTSICDRIDYPTKVTAACVTIGESSPGWDLIQVDLIAGPDFDRVSRTTKAGDLWTGPPLPTPDPRVWRLVGPSTPTDAWFPTTVSVSRDNVVNDIYHGQHVFLNNLWARVQHVTLMRHPYGG